MKWLALLLCIVSVASQAEVTPKAQSFDARITLVKYNPEDVIRVRTKIGTTTLIQLERGETIFVPEGGISSGDDNAWTIGVRKHNIFLLPKAKSFSTNMVIVTDKGRTYSFRLVESKYPHFIVKLDYEKPITGKDRKFDTPCFDEKANFNYGKWGDDSIAPTYMWDDGRFTCLKFTKNAELPVAYKVSPDGTESLINYHLEKDTMVLQGISKEFRLRLGGLVLGLRSEEAVSRGYNDKATSINATRRLQQ